MKLNSKNKDLLRFLTCGSVDDGKSTLLGRLLSDSNKLTKDQIVSLHKESVTYKNSSNNEIDYALLLDGLSVEREQGITIDVAYRYFETDKRKFIITDTPGHKEYTRNMVTGASNSDLAIIVIDCLKGLSSQSKQHAFIISLLQIPHLIVAINKMDLVEYSERVFEKIVFQTKEFCEKLDINELTFIPISALKGDNVVTSSLNMSWYKGPTLLQYLEEININSYKNLIDFRYPIQYIIRSNQNYRGYAGRVESGSIRKGEEIVVLPSGNSSYIKEIQLYNEKLDEAETLQSVVLTLADEIDISRGDMLVRKNNLPLVGNHLDVLICWLDSNPMDSNFSYILKHTTKKVNAQIEQILYKIDVNTLHRINTNTIRVNDIARVTIRTTQPLFFDSYKMNRITGSFILIDPITNNTVGAGIIKNDVRNILNVSKNDIGDKKLNHKYISNDRSSISLKDREKRNEHKAAVLWFTGLSGSGKSTITRELERQLFSKETQVSRLDGDNIRNGLCNDLGFSSDDRKENIRRIGEVAKLFFDSGSIVLCSFISPFNEDRGLVRQLFPVERFIEIYVKCDLEICKERDPKGLYEKVKKGEIKEFTGIDAPYEIPIEPEIIVETNRNNLQEVVYEIIDELYLKGIII